MTQPPPSGGYTPRWPGERPISGQGAPLFGPTPHVLGQHPTPKKKSGCVKAILIVFGIFIVLVLTILVIAGIQGDIENSTSAKNEETVESGQEENPEPAHNEPLHHDESHDDQGSVEEGEPEVTEDDPQEEGPTGPTFRGMQDNDMVTVPGEILSGNKANYRTAPLRQYTTLGINLLCTTVSIGNPGKGNVDFSYFEWELQNPNGVIVSPTVFDGGRPTLEGRGELAPSGVTQGDVCFEGDSGALPGEYIVLRDASTFFTTKRMAWVNYF